MREIVLSNGMVARVDDEDYARLCLMNWRAQWDKSAKCFYAISGGVLMHRAVFCLKKGDTIQVDHREPEDTLNNQKYNLRLATQCQNQANRRKNSNNTSGYKGVSWNSKRRVWQSSIGADRRNIFLGRFKTAEDAYAAYCEAAMRLHGEFARLA